MKNTVRSVLACALALAPVLAAAQAVPPAPNPVTDAVRALLGRESKNLIASTTLMPADKFGYRPTDEQMTFGELVVHVVQTNVVSVPVEITAAQIILTFWDAKVS